MAAQGAPDDRGTTADELRDEYPSGWRVLTRHDSVAAMIDAVMDALPGEEFTKSELAERAGVSRQSVHTHYDLLLTVGILEPVDGSSPQRYRANADSELLRLLHEVDGAVNEKLGESV